MGCRGVLFALTDRDVKELCAIEEDRRVEHVTDVIEEREIDGEWAVETDKAWDAIHRCLAGGRLEWDGGDDPLECVILRGEPLYSGDDYILSHKSPALVRQIAAKIGDVTHDDMRARYYSIDPDAYGMPLSDEDWEYTWHWFKSLVDFYRRAAQAGRHVLFTADQ